jgi:hypothetical protein
MHRLSRIGCIEKPREAIARKEFFADEDASIFNGSYSVLSIVFWLFARGFNPTYARIDEKAEIENAWTRCFLRVSPGDCIRSFVLVRRVYPASRGEMKYSRWINLSMSCHFARLE